MALRDPHTCASLARDTFGIRVTGRTVEQLIKFDSGLSIGRTAVQIIRRDGSTYCACVEIGDRGAVYVIPKPAESDMYTSWYRVRGDTLRPHGTPVVWGARTPAVMGMFNNPSATIDLRHTQ